jgi:hypothetical protein
MALPETQAMDSILFPRRYPQIMYNHHQTGPIGFALRRPFAIRSTTIRSRWFHGADLVGAAMHSRFVAEAKRARRCAAARATRHGGTVGRTTVYFHNMIGLLTEAIGNPDAEIPLVPDTLLPRRPADADPALAYFAQPIACMSAANRAVLTSHPLSGTVLLQHLSNGTDSIERSTDWTITPR